MKEYFSDNSAVWYTQVNVFNVWSYGLKPEHLGKNHWNWRRRFIVTLKNQAGITHFGPSCRAVLSDGKQGRNITAVATIKHATARQSKTVILTQVIRTSRLKWLALVWLEVKATTYFLIVISWWEQYSSCYQLNVKHATTWLYWEWEQNKLTNTRSFVRRTSTKHVTRQIAASCIQYNTIQWFVTRTKSRIERRIWGAVYLLSRPLGLHTQCLSAHFLFAHNVDIMSTDFHNFWRTYSTIFIETQCRSIDQLNIKCTVNAHGTHKRVKQIMKWNGLFENSLMLSNVINNNNIRK